MKIVKIMGGLGNQMFQYAFGVLIGADAYDVSWFQDIKKNKNITQRQYELNYFKCNPNILTRKQSKRIVKGNKLLKLFGIKTGLSVVKENPENIYNPKITEYKQGFFDGYFQCYQYYNKIRKRLLKDFVLKQKPNKKNKEILDLISSVNSVSVHIRRGDYLKLQHVHGLCDLNYYNKAINFMAGKIKNPYFVIFSDDIDWVKNNLKITYPYIVVDFNRGQDSIWDMFLMKNCKHNIVANSSFSWWGAWLNENKNKIVIAPKQWFKIETDIVPDTWKRI